MIENVQIHATKLVDRLRCLSYSERLKKLDLPTLVYRRARGGMIEIYKHFNSYDKAILSHSFQPRKRQSRNTISNLSGKCQRTEYATCKQNRFIIVLPKHGITSTFKSMLDKTWSNNPFRTTV